ncbi:MAG: hypothetical protein ACRDFS_04710 [Chloroflexota bacterium]
MSDHDRPAEERARTVLDEYARTLLETGDASIAAEFEQCRGWLDMSGMPTRTEYWNVEAVAGATGALANAWGRLTLRSRANGTFPVISGRLDEVMDQLVALRRCLAQGAVDQGEFDLVRRVLDALEATQQTVATGDVS